jgi:hypothetical protein
MLSTGIFSGKDAKSLPEKQVDAIITASEVTKADMELVIHEKSKEIF